MCNPGALAILLSRSEQGGYNRASSWLTLGSGLPKSRLLARISSHDEYVYTEGVCEVASNSASAYLLCIRLTYTSPLQGQNHGYIR